MPRDLKPLRAVFALEVHELSWPEVFERLRLRLCLRLALLLLALRLLLLLLLLLLLAFPLSPVQCQKRGRQDSMKNGSLEYDPKQPSKTNTNINRKQH